MSMDLTGITNKNEYYTNHYFSTVFEENTRANSYVPKVKFGTIKDSL